MSDAEHDRNDPDAIRAADHVHETVVSGTLAPLASTRTTTSFHAVTTASEDVDTLPRKDSKRKNSGVIDPNVVRPRSGSLEEAQDQVSELMSIGRLGQQMAANTASTTSIGMNGSSTNVMALPRMKSTLLERFSSLDPSNLETLLSGGLDRFYGKYKNAWKKHNLSFPTPEIHFDNLSYSVRTSDESPASRASIAGALKGIVAPWRKLKSKKKQILHPMSGIIRPGTMTLVLANPGAGKSTFFKAIAGKLKTGKGRSLKGNITYSGLPAEDINISKLIGLVDQQDNHFPTLTVRETIQFADRCLNGPPSRQPEKLREVARLRTDLCLHILGLTKCADTYVGDALLRGVSGGERKRVTLGEMLVGGQSVFLCDEISTGLDSAATFDIMQALQSWTRSLGGSAVVALLQPPPEVVELFDDIMVLTEGRLVYHGPRVEMLPYFESLGFAYPVNSPQHNIDPAEFIIDVVSGRGAPFLIKHPREEAIKTKPPRKAHQFEEAFMNSAIYQKNLAKIRQAARFPDKAETDLQTVAHLLEKDASESSLYHTGFWECTSLLLARQKKIWLRDRALIYGKLLEAVLVGLLLGIIYLDAPTNIYLRMIFFCIAIFQRQSWQQLTISFQVRNIFYKQRSRRFFRTRSYTLAETLVQIPLNVCVSFALVVIFYFMAGLAPSATTFFVFYAIIVSFQHAMGAYFSLLASLSPSVTVAQALASLSVSFFLLFSGNIILPQLIPKYWMWMHWFNPLAWTVRSCLLNEFHDARYTEAQRATALARFQVTKGPAYIWIGIVVLLAYYVLFTLINTIVLAFVQFEMTSTAVPAVNSTEDSYSTEEKTRQPSLRNLQQLVNTSNQAEVDPEKVEKNDVVVNVPSEQASAAPVDETSFIPGYLAVRDLSYFVKHPNGKGELQLLHGINAYFTPGKMTALMGSSGAGKTTFMDVLAGRKTGGRITGEILVNGEPKNPTTFSRIAGYCEQMDIHSGGATVLEALQFSARLRLSPTISASARQEIVNNTMELLELQGIASDMVRNCSIEQKKRITIAVELVANPSILFLDEPTSGLDGPSASIVMRGVRSIARTGRTIVCTIHQPSKQIFEMFDALLLLQKGGFTAFFGDLGRGSEKMVEYFERIPGTERMEPNYNPATYMLEVIGAGIGRGQARDYSVEYKNSALFAQNLTITERIAQGKCPDGDKEMARFSSMNLTPIATGFANQFVCCVTKMTMTYWRNPHYNLMRMVAFPIYAVIFGSTFFKLPQETPAQVNSHVGLMYNTLDFIGVINLMTVLDTIVSERAVFYRERMSNYYGPLPYALSLSIAEFPYLVFVSFIFMNVQYWMVGWETNESSFFIFWFVFYLHISICTSVGQFMAVLMPNIKVANVANGALSVFFNLFAGFLMPHASMQAFYRWIRYLVPSSYSLGSLVAIEMGQCNSSHHGCSLVKIPSTATTAASTISLKDYIAVNYGFLYANVGTNIVVLIGMWVLLQVFIYLTLRFVSHLKR